MPRYFFHIQSEADPDGAEFESERDAKIEALRYAGSLLVHEPHLILEHESWRLAVADANGSVVYALTVTAG